MEKTDNMPGRADDFEALINSDLDKYELAGGDDTGNMEDNLTEEDLAEIGQPVGETEDPQGDGPTDPQDGMDAPGGKRRGWRKVGGPMQGRIEEELKYNVANATTDDVLSEMEKLKLMCQKLGLPMFVTVCMPGGEDGPEYVNDAITPRDLGMRIEKNYINPCLLAVNGFQVMSRKPTDLDRQVMLDAVSLMGADGMDDYE